MTRVPITSSGVRGLLSLAGGSLRVSFEPVGWNSAPSWPELDEPWAISDSAWRCRGKVSHARLTGRPSHAVTSRRGSAYAYKLPIGDAT